MGYLEMGPFYIWSHNPVFNSNFYLCSVKDFDCHLHEMKFDNG